MRPRARNSLFALDAREAKKVQGLIAGVDEAGRGPLAGPVVAAAVIFFPSSPRIPVNDSKKLTPQKRSRLFLEIIRQSLVGIGRVEESEIDRLNIFQATRLAMKKAVMNLSRTPDFLLIDGKITLDLPIPQKSIVKGDAQSAVIAAASIVAKVFRDAWMEHLDGLYPEYQFRRHKGYGTEAHFEVIRRLGPSPVHRRSFRPIRTSEEFA